MGGVQHHASLRMSLERGSISPVSPTGGHTCLLLGRGPASWAEPGSRPSFPLAPPCGSPGGAVTLLCLWGPWGQGCGPPTFLGTLFPGPPYAAGSVGFSKPSACRDRLGKVGPMFHAQVSPPTPGYPSRPPQVLFLSHGSGRVGLQILQLSKHPAGMEMPASPS